MNHLPHVTFTYDIKKDVANIRIGLKLVAKGRQADRELQAIIDKYGNAVTNKQLATYIEDKLAGKDEAVQNIINSLQKYWDSIESKFFLHITDRMQIKTLPEIGPLSGHFSLRYGSGYDADENWFAVSLHDGTFRNTLTAMHEIMHIIFHKAWWGICQKQGLPEKNIWDVKEAVTVLLNLWFKDVLIDLDWGYEEHAELRHLIKQWFLDSRDFKSTLLRACEYMKQNPNKSPLWK